MTFPLFLAGTLGGATGGGLSTLFNKDKSLAAFLKNTVGGGAIAGSQAAAIAGMGGFGGGGMGGIGSGMGGAESMGGLGSMGKGQKLASILSMLKGHQQAPPPAMDYAPQPIPVPESLSPQQPQPQQGVQVSSMFPQNDPFRRYGGYGGYNG